LKGMTPEQYLKTERTKFDRHFSQPKNDAINPRIIRISKNCTVQVLVRNPNGKGFLKIIRKKKGERER